MRGKGRDQRRQRWRVPRSRQLQVSVPLRGKGRDQPKRRFVWTPDELLEFPSPCGEKVGINVIKAKAKSQSPGEFPSPCGEKVGINCSLFPYKGGRMMFPSPCGEKVGINARRKFNRIVKKTVFPSPCGEKVGINGDVRKRRRDAPRTKVSVPLRGKGRDQRVEEAKTALAGTAVSVPLRGKGRDQPRK